MTQNKNLKIGLTLGGGGIRGFLHLGFYEVLCENEIPVDCVSGTSMGAIIGGCIAMGYSPEAVHEFALKYKKLNLLSLKNFGFFNDSLFKRDEIDKILELTFGDSTFDDTKIPFRCCSVDIESHEKVVHSTGLLRTAIAASSSYPPVFAPIFHENRCLSDGGILDPVPVMALRDIKVEKLIAVRIRHSLTRQQLSAMIYKKHYDWHVDKKYSSWYQKPLSFIRNKKENLKFMLNMIVESTTIAAGKLADMEIEKAKPDLLLTPTVNIGLLDFERIEEAIDLGRKLGREHIADIKKLL